jgi:hypothetical protein
MTTLSIGIRLATVFTLVLASSSARAECIGGTEWWLSEKGVELVFSGTVTKVTRTAELGYRATFDVDRVWKGAVPKHFDLWVWELAAEMDRVEVGRRYIVGAKRLVDARARQGAGLAGTDTVAFTQVMCGAKSYKEAEQTGSIPLAAGKPPL